MKDVRASVCKPKILSDRSKYSATQLVSSATELFGLHSLSSSRKVNGRDRGLDAIELGLV